MPLAPGDLISHYQIISLLGRGGMGEVYEALDTNLSRRVALKILSSQFIRSDEAVGRFIQEARAASALNHPNIVTVHEVGQADDVRYIAMELIEGETLRTLVARDALSLRERVDILAQVAAGLAKAHAAGIVHRDLKPDNVMITTDGYAKVLDFGLAKLTEKEGEPHSGSTSPQLTQVGTILGTVGYMSPEQVEHRPIDFRSDVFSFGCIAYQALTGHAPFERGSIIDTLHSIVHAVPPPLADILPDAPAPLVDIIEECLAKNPNERPQSMREVAAQLQDIARATDPKSMIRLPQARPRRLSSRASLIVAAIIFIAGAGLVAVAVKRQNTPAPFDAMRITRMASSGRSTFAAISPDGKYLTYSVDEGGKQSLWIRQVASSSDIRIVPLADVHFVGGAFSPDANFLYYCSADNRTDQGAVYQVPVIGGVPKQIVDDLHVRMMVSPDGKRFAYAKTDRAAGRSIVATRQMDGTGERVVAERKLPDTFTAVTWSPDGESLGYSFVTYGGGYHAVIGDVKIEGGKERVISGPTWRIVDSLIWLPDDQLVVNAKDKSDSRNQLWMLRRDGRARRITNDLSDYEQASVTSDGTKLVTLQKNQTSSVWIAPGGVAQHARQLARGADNLDGMYGLTCLRDGHIVYTSSSNDARDLWIMDRDGGSRRRLSDGGSDTLPAASPDGKLIVFMSMRTGRSNIWRLDVATGATAPITSGDFESSPSLSPDGTWVAFHTNRSGVRTVWRTGVIGGGPVKQVTTTASSWPSVSPDGKQIACSWFDPTNGRIGIAVVPSDGGAPSHIFDIPVNAWMGGNNHHVRWHESGLTYVSNLNGVSNIWLQPLDGGDARQLTRFEDGQIFYFDWTADGRDLVASRGEVTSNVVLIDGFR